MNILITGASSGIGREVATRLQAKGHTVIGTSRKPRHDKLFSMLELDVNSDQSARACVSKALEMTGGIDVLVNNAGYDLYAAAEETSDAELRAQLENHFFGAVRMSQLLVPHMRQRSSGKIVQLSSFGGLFALSYNSAYAASEFALEGYSEALRYELLPFNVFVSLIEPAGVHTETLESSVRLSQTAHQACQGAARAAAEAPRANSRRSGLNVSSMADNVVRTILQPRPGLRVPLAGIARFLPFVRPLAPNAFEAMMRTRFIRHSALPTNPTLAQPTQPR